jgi:hypothetical protein
MDHPNTITAAVRFMRHSLLNRFPTKSIAAARPAPAPPRLEPTDHPTPRSTCPACSSSGESD